ncbi:MAG: calcium/sodium antiporter [Lentisphaerae bacterium]|nr:calcium/sodium antiporter [Lentisphaerota bacterium]
MQEFQNLISESVPLSWIVLIASFAILAKCADIFVGSSVSLAQMLKIPKLVVGIVLVSLATTAPELSVSLAAALRGNPEMALGNAIGSVICDDGLAMGLCGLLTVAVIKIDRRTFRLSAGFLLLCQAAILLFVAPDRTLSRIEGLGLVAMFIAYTFYLFHEHKAGKLETDPIEINMHAPKTHRLSQIVALFVLALGGIVLASEFIITSATSIAHSFGIPEAVIALSLVALGTSIPEIATCIAAARKNEGAIAVGNILGADIMNICWVAGASAIANNLTLGDREIYFMFPWMLFIVGVMLISMRLGYTLTKRKGALLLALYILYIASFFLVYSSDASSRLL